MYLFIHFCSYVASFHMTLNLDDALKEKQQKPEEISGPSKPEVGSPNILEAGLTRAALESLGYKFKEDQGGDPPARRHEAERVAVEQRRNDPGTSQAAEESPLSAEYGSRYNSPAACNSFSTTTPTTDDDTPRPIIKKTTVVADAAAGQGCYTPPPPPVPQQRTAHKQQQQQQQQHQLHDVSRIEITPGLFVRKPATSGGSGRNRGAGTNNTPLRREAALNSWNTSKSGGKGGGGGAVTGGDASPKMPELQTVNLQELLLESSVANQTSSCATNQPTLGRNAALSREEEESVGHVHRSVVDEEGEEGAPPTPNLKTMNLREVLQPKERQHQQANSAKKEGGKGEENRDPEHGGEVGERLTPDTPDFKDRFMRELARSGMKKRPEGSPGVGVGVEVGADESPGTPPMPALSSVISRSIFNRETHL